MSKQRRKQVAKELEGSLEQTGDDSFSWRLDEATSLYGEHNTAERAVRWRELLEDERLQDYPVMAGLEESWQLLSSMYGEDPVHGGALIKRAERADCSPLRTLLYYLDAGFYPPPEFLLAVSACVRKYFAAGGDISLDEAFFGKPHKKYGSAADEQCRRDRYIGFQLFCKLDEGPEKPKRSLSQLAEDYLLIEVQGAEAMDVESFLRGYRRWKEMEKNK